MPLITLTPLDRAVESKVGRQYIMKVLKDVIMKVSIANHAIITSRRVSSPYLRLRTGAILLLPLGRSGSSFAAIHPPHFLPPATCGRQQLAAIMAAYGNPVILDEGTMLWRLGPRDAEPWSPLDTAKDGFLKYTARDGFLEMDGIASTGERCVDEVLLSLVREMEKQCLLPDNRAQRISWNAFHLNWDKVVGSDAVGHAAILTWNEQSLMCRVSIIPIGEHQKSNMIIGSKRSNPLVVKPYYMTISGLCGDIIPPGADASRLSVRPAALVKYFGANLIPTKPGVYGSKPPAAAAPKLCGVCCRAATFICSRCRTAWYCCVGCQVNHWDNAGDKGHRAWCKWSSKLQKKWGADSLDREALTEMNIVIPWH